jgi:cell division protein FtsB
MLLSRRLRRWLGALVTPAFGIALTAYFAYNLVIGERGLLAWQKLSQQLQAEQTRLAALQVEHRALERKVSELSPEHLDPDLLDERVRATLNLAAPNEVVIMRDSAAH